MDRQYEDEYLREYNEVCGRILCRERKKRKISQEKLAWGILSKTTLENIESGIVGWTKVTGDTLMHRMGIATDYFEVMASAEELDRWRMREDICLLAPQNPATAMEKVHEYRRRYGKREPIEEQFMIKVELLLMLEQRKEMVSMEGKIAEEADKILEIAQKAVSCTIPGGWETNLDSLWLAPSELEALLLAAVGLRECDREDEALALWQSVWDYPKMRNWKGRMRMLIAPQAALAGMQFAMYKGDGRTAFALGREALELLRHNFSHCYVLPLLEYMCSIPAGSIAGYGEAERGYLCQAESFRDTFRQIYKEFDYPGYRIWQGISVDNTKEIGITLRMLRRFVGKSHVKSIVDDTGIIVTKRQLEKIEKGVHKPSYENYRRLIRQYGKPWAWKTALLETDSIEVLELRQEISTLLGLEEWERAKGKMNLFRGKVNADSPRVKQELLFWEAIMKWKKENAMEESLGMLMEALHCTMPDMEGREMKWWVFQREEMIIACNIAVIYRRLKRVEESEKWHNAILSSLEIQRGRTGIPYIGYDILMEGYDNLLGDTKRFGEAVEMNKKAVQDYLKWSQMTCIASAFYRIAWNLYEVSAENAEEDVYRQKWKNAFQISVSLSKFTYDTQLEAFLSEETRRIKFQS